jgi:hypothetical protein
MQAHLLCSQTCGKLLASPPADNRKQKSLMLRTNREGQVATRESEDKFCRAETKREYLLSLV